MKVATTAIIARIVMITGLLVPWTAAQTAKPPKSEGYSFRGQVIDASTGRPRGDVEVQLEIDYNVPVAPPTKPDANGQFMFSGLKVGRYNLIAKLGNSRVPFGELPSGEFRTVPVGPEDEGKTVIFRLAPDTVIEGTIRDPQGVPIPQAIVTLSKAAWRGGEVVVIGVAQEQTDELGRYRIPGVRPGRYALCGIGPPGWVAPPVGTINYAQGEQHHFYGMKCYLDGPMQLLIKAGDRPQIDLKLPVRSGVTLKGSVLGVSQHTYGEVRLYGELPFTGADVSFGQIPLSGSGDFQFKGLLPGKYRLEAYTNSPSLRTITTVAIGTTAPPPIEIKPEGVSIIDVVVHAPPGRTADSIPMAISLRPNQPGSNIAEQVQKDGSAPVRFSRLTPGQYWLIIRTNERLCAVAATLNGHDVLRKPLAISAGVGGQLHITFSDRCGVVSGSVWQGARVAPFSRLLLLRSGSASEPGDLDNRQISDEDGGFVFDSLAPGHYSLWAWTQDDPSYLGPERLKEVLGVAVDVRAGETTSVKLQLIRRGGGSK